MILKYFPPLQFLDRAAVCGTQQALFAQPVLVPLKAFYLMQFIHAVQEVKLITMIISNKQHLKVSPNEQLY